MAESQPTDQGNLPLVTTSGENAINFFDIKVFKEKLNVILDKIFVETNNSELKTLFKNIRDIYEYNVFNGKYNRGMFVVNTFAIMASKAKKEILPDEKEDCYILGWIIEMLQAFALILDDIIDDSKTRRGQMCWYKKVGISAINDALLLEQQCYQIMNIFFSEKSYYTKLLDNFHKMSLLTTYGQLMDLKSVSDESSGDVFTNFTESRLESIYKYKTSYYSFVLPVKLALILCSFDSEDDLKTNEIILLKIGHLFQMQDDFIDCFGDPAVTGKIGSDIEDGKCCWPIVMALKLCDERQLCVLRDNYGHKSELNVKAVKQVYYELNLKQIYETETKRLQNDIKNDIKALKLHSNSNLCPDIYEHILNRIVGRNK